MIRIRTQPETTHSPEMPSVIERVDIIHHLKTALGKAHQDNRFLHVEPRHVEKIMRMMIWPKDFRGMAEILEELAVCLDDIEPLFKTSDDIKLDDLIHAVEFLQACEERLTHVGLKMRMLPRDVDHEGGEEDELENRSANAFFRGYMGSGSLGVMMWTLPNNHEDAIRLLKGVLYLSIPYPDDIPDSKLTA